jgi:predicted nucleotide-binding protein (sugar kinase/HSP70/actin superfamily)
MIVTLPHLGPLWIAASQFFIYNDVLFAKPPDNGQRALSEGSKVSPEEMCLPFKYMVGNLMAAHNLGADTAIMISTNGPCRLGEYGEMMKVVLDNAGVQYKWVVLESLGFSDLKKLFCEMKGEKLNAKDGLKGVLGLLLSMVLIFDIDLFERKVLKKSGYTVESGESVRLLKNIKQRLQLAESYKESFGIICAGKKAIKSLKVNKSATPVKVYITGEIYTSIEAEANGHIEELLMMSGCSVRRHIDISWWIIHSVKRKLIPEFIYRRIDGRRPVKNNVGGYGRESAHKINNNKWADGIIKIMPAGCMPEIVTKAYCEGVSDADIFKNKNILHLIYDEIREDAGYVTRVEAFVDMLERKKNVLAGNRHRIHKH